LHLAWGSPRFSEDLDFILAREFGQTTRLRKSVARRLDGTLQAVAGGATVALKQCLSNLEVHLAMYSNSPRRKAFAGHLREKADTLREGRTVSLIRADLARWFPDETMQVLGLDDLDVSKSLVLEVAQVLDAHADQLEQDTRDDLRQRP